MGSSRDGVDVEILNAGYRYALSLSANRQDAEDLVHDAWIRLDKRYGGRPDKPLLFRTIRNLYIDQYRRQQKIRFSEYDESMSNPALTGDQRGAQESGYASAYMAAEEMQLLLDQLRDVEREALFLSVVEGYTADEVAQMTSSTRGTVLSLMHRAKGKLRQWLTADSQDVQNPDQTGDVVVALKAQRKVK